MEQTIKVLVYTHAFFGGLGLITGMISLLVKKGSAIHKKSGKVFSFSMIFSSLISLVVARMPNHENQFLFLIGIFTIYLVLSGNRALTLKSKKKLKADYIDKSISGIMLLTSVVMIVFGIINLIENSKFAVLYIFFGALGAFLSMRDFQTFKTFTKDKSVWIKSHIGRMVGALIASITAFLVAGLHIGTTLVWITPTILGIIYILYWTKKFAIPTLHR